jgi:hypothetical protein
VEAREAFALRRLEPVEGKAMIGYPSASVKHVPEAQR